MGQVSDIVYRFEENRDGLDHIQRVVDDIRSVASDVRQIFLSIDQLWVGRTPEALQATHASINQKLDDYLHAVQTTGAGAHDQQDEMEALDNSLAGGF